MCGEFSAFPCSQGRGDCAFCLPNRVGEILHFSLSSGERRFALSMKKIARSGINELCEMANMPGVGLEIFKAGGGWRDQKWAPPRSVKLPSLRQGRMQTLPCSLGRCAGSLVFFPCSQGRGDCAFCLPNRVGRVQSSLLFGQVERTLPDPGAGKA
ncbi:hypothetical protein T4C_2354 [Trichinella pseudospiralis]|uniref:Uncharacterized protein n=1 Tax=Trichinella pseudospiralis TaxID=6337 RepID=A0A0V1JJS9_TRIPS|nr:hypothetical protein T4C_2354 [Trichinella pseudospiralis]